MPSRKKAKGKARKAAKAKEDSRAVTAANQRREESVEAQMQRLIINAVSPKLCTHGCPSLPPGEMKICQDFINAYIDAFFSDVEVELVEAFLIATDTTVKTYENIYYSKLDTVISILLRNGTQCILDGNNVRAKLHASLASYFEEYNAYEVRKTKAMINWTKPFELLRADDHTLVAYYKKRISCCCLDEKYNEVKSVKKMGFCCNISCSEPERKVERCKMFSCTQCGEVNYCSIACQKNHWKQHKEFCAQTAAMKAAFRSNQT